MAHQFDTGDPISGERARELLADLEESNHLGVRKTRASAARSIKAVVEVRSGDVCSRATVLSRGNTSELQRQGVSCVLEHPVMTGSVFLLEFDRAVLDLAPELAVCDRATMLSDTAFDTHFRFVREIDLPSDDGW